MSTVAAPPRLEPGTPPAPPEPPAGGRRLGALLPLLAVFAAAVLVYGFQAWQHEVPWLFQDEIFYASQAREYAESGDITIRGQSDDADGLTARVTSIAWHFDDPEVDYLAAKLLNVLLMAAACFPAYGLARMVVSRAWALFAAAGTVSIPAFVYTSMILTEPFGYLVATTAFWMMARTLALDRLGPRALAWGIPTLALCWFAQDARQQLRILAPIFVFMIVVRLLLAERVRRRRVLAGIAWVAFAAIVAFSYHYYSHEDGYLFPTNGHWDVIGKQAAWGFGAFAIGLGVIPAVLGLAALWPDRERRHRPEHVAFSIVASVGIAAVIFYTALKGAYIWFTFAYRVVERNAIYATPLLFVAVAIFLQYRRRVNPLALAAALAAVAYSVYEVPYQLEFRIYSDAPGLAILSTANRHFAWTDGSVHKYLAVMLALSALVALAPYVVRSRRVWRVGAVLLAFSLVGLPLTAEIAADRSARGTSTMFAENLPKPYDWVYEATGGKRGVLIGTAIADPNGIWLTQFFNPNLYYLASLDGTAPAPGPNDSLDVVDDDGLVYQQYPDAEYALVDNKVTIEGTVVRRTTYQTLYRIATPLRLAQASYGVSGDGWMLGDAEKRATGRYYQFSSPESGPGVIRVVASRAAWGGEDVPGNVTIRVSPIRWEGPHDFSDGKMVEGTPFALERLTIHTRQIVEYLIPVPGPPFVVDVTVEPTFSPADFGLGDSRQLGIQPSFEYLPNFRLNRVLERELNPPAIPE